MKRTAIMLLLVTTACTAARRENPGYSGTLDRLGVPHPTLQPRMKPVDLATWPRNGANGLTVRRLTGTEAGLPRTAAPYANFVTAEEVRRLTIAGQSTGVFIVDTDYVPRELEQILERNQLTVRQDRSLVDRNGEPVAMFITNEMFVAREGQQQSRPRASSGPNQGLGGSDSRADGDSQFPWRCYSFSPWALYHGGWHRWYEARTDVGAYGADSRGGCSGSSPRTNIDYLQTRAAVGWPGALSHCFNCTTHGSYDSWNVGYFWPAHGIPRTTHSAVWAHGTFSFSRTTSLTW